MARSCPHLISTRTTLRIGSVSFLNARPLIYGLDADEAVDLTLDVPSRLLDGLIEGRFDIALLPVIDYQRMPGLRLIGSGGIASDGPTLTVRIFSPCPIEDVHTLACDTDSHTSVALARIIFGERYHASPEFVPLDRASSGQRIARLLIGDKVVCEGPPSLPHQLDLGQAWKELTGLPFAFATWMARPGINLAGLPRLLEQAKFAGKAHLDEIIERFAVPRGWPPELAARYLTQHLQFDIDEQHLEAIRLFHRLAFQYGLIPREPWPLDVIESA